MKRLSLFVLVAVLITTRFFWLNSGVPYTHDGENHLARFANYKLAVKEGQLPPRFAPNLHNRYGYPVFNYNYPLANILSLPFSLLRVHYELTFKLIIFWALMVGCLGLIRWLKPYARSNRPILAALITYLSGPPLISTLLFRGSIGEILAYALWPWLFVSVRALSKRLNIKLLVLNIFIWSTFLLAHNISVYLAVFIISIYSLWQLIATQEKKLFIFQMSLVLIASMGLTLWFWLPAITEMNEVVVGQAANQREYLLHFPTLKQLIYSPLAFGYSYPGPVDTLSFWLGWVIPSVLILLLALAIANIWFKQLKIKSLINSLKSKPWLLFTCLLLLSLYLQTSNSSDIWQLIPNFRLIQFPWRFGLISTILSLPLVVWLLESKNKTINKIIWLVIFIQLIVALSAQPNDYVTKQKYEYDLHGGTTSTQNENMPPAFRYLLIADWQPSPSVLAGDAQIAKVELWSGSQHLYRINVATTATIVEPTMNFLGWETRARSIIGADSTNSLVNYIDSDEIQGRIAYVLAPGIYQIETKFTQNTPARQIGNFALFFTIAIMTGIFVWRKLRL